jgi:hypothetical protein
MRAPRDIGHRPSDIGRLLVLLLLASALPAADLKGLALDDHLGERHDLGAETPGRLAMLFSIGQRIGAKDWDDSLTAHLPKDHPLVRILDGSAIRAEDRPRLVEKVTRTLQGTGVRFLLDWEGAARKRLAAPADAVRIVAFDATGALAGQVDGPANARDLTAALALVGVVPDPPLVDSGRGKGGGAR